MRASVLSSSRRATWDLGDKLAGGIDMSDYVIIEKADNEAIAQLIKQRLDEAGIPCMIASGALGAVAGPGASYAVRVPADRADEARELLGD
jgi:hypothetical protein